MPGSHRCWGQLVADSPQQRTVCSAAQQSPGNTSRRSADGSPQSDALTVPGNLAAAALRKRLDSELLLWLVAIELKASPGANGISRRRLVRTAFEWGLFSRSYARQLLTQGDEVFWHLGAHTAFLIGTAGVAALLGANRYPQHRQIIALDGLRGGIAKRRGALFGAVAPDDRPMSQITLRMLTGISERSQRRYRSAGSFESVCQIADLTVLLPEDWLRPSLEYWARANRAKGIYASGGTILKRLPNLHVPAGERIPPGDRSKHLFRELQALNDGEGTQSPRVWFDSHSDWRRCSAPKLGVQSGDRYVDPERGLNVAYVQSRDGKWEAVAMLTGR